MAYALIAVAVSASSVGEAMRGFDLLEIRTHCSSLYCEHLPMEQWKVEARRWFKASLARIQVELVNTLRGTVNNPSDHYRIPPPYRRMCDMGKFKSVGWRNVSVWGFAGLLFLAGSISLGSIKTEEGNLWLVVGAQVVMRTFSWSSGKAKQIMRTLSLGLGKARQILRRLL